MADSLPRRHSVRLHYWDYSRPGWYFLTLCTHRRRCLFGSVEGAVCVLSAFGRIVEEQLLRSVELRSELRLDSFVIMPNHIHLIAVLSAKENPALDYSRQPHQRERRSISSFMGGFKSKLTASINSERGSPGESVLQRGFHEHIIRTEGALNRIRQYIADNPARWELDHLHPRAAPGQEHELETLLRADAKYR